MTRHRDINEPTVPFDGATLEPGLLVMRTSDTEAGSKALECTGSLARPAMVASRGVSAMLWCS